MQYTEQNALFMKCSLVRTFYTLVAIHFEEFAATGSLVDFEVEQSPNLNIRTQSISGKRSTVKLAYVSSILVTRNFLN